MSIMSGRAVAMPGPGAAAVSMPGPGLPGPHLDSEPLHLTLRRPSMIKGSLATPHQINPVVF